MTDESNDDDTFEHAACGLLQTLEDGTITRANRIFCEWLGRSAGELVGQRLQALFTPGGRLFYQTHWAPQLRTWGSVAEVKVDVLHRDGEFVPMLFNASRRHRGELARVDVAAMVVRDRQKYERELVAARAAAEAAQERLAEENVRKDQFLATMAHELRNPLAPLVNGVNLLKQPAIGAAIVTRVIDMFDRQVRQLTRLVDDLLEVSRLNRGTLALRRERIDLREPIADAIEAAMPAISHASQTLHRQLPDAPVMLQADAARVTQMVLNLLNNASRYTPAGGQIWLAVDVRDDVVVTARDSGIGLSPANLSWIFEMFSQVTPATQGGGGLGIGLALVKRLAELHGGSVRAESPGEGLGSTFTLTLPREIPDDAQEKQAA